MEINVHTITTGVARPKNDPGRNAPAPGPRCVVLVPAHGPIDNACEEGLRELERRGYTIWRGKGYSAIDQARCHMASDALAQGFDELFWIDSDIVFHPDDVDKMRLHKQPFVCGLYAKKGPRQFACEFPVETKSLIFGPSGGLTEIPYAGFGFVYTHRSLYELIQKHCQLPTCQKKSHSPIVPYFLPFLAEVNDDVLYLSEDYAFCHRAREAGVKLLADTRVRLFHVGTYQYSWEEVAVEAKRYGTFTFNMQGPAN